MISVKNIYKRYAARVIFSDVSFDVLAGEKIGLVGRNGHGKTTLFRIITGEEEPDQGKVFMPNNYSIGYLGQHLTFTRPTVLEECCVKLGPEEMGAEWKVEKILSGLGFNEKDFNRGPSEFSGGFQMRIALTKALVSEPNMLLLDEPTNFLDIVSIRWLEKFLRSWKGELIVISHDRDLIDSVTTHIVGIHRGRVRKMKGSTGKYYAQLHKDEEVREKRRLADEIISSESRVAAVNEELTKTSVRGGLGAIRRSELSRELKALAEKIGSRYSNLDETMKAYDAEKRKYSGE